MAEEVKPNLISSENIVNVKAMRVIVDIALNLRWLEGRCF